MKKNSIIGCAILIFLSAAVQAQQTDTTRVDQLISKADSLRRFDVDTTLALARTALAQAEEIDYIRGQLRAFQSMGIAYGMSDQYEQSIDCFNSVINIAIKNNRLKKVGEAHVNLGIVYKRIGDYPTSYHHYNEAFRFFKNTDDPAAISLVYSNLGILLDLMGEKEEAYHYYQLYYEISDSLGREMDRRNALTNMAIYYDDIGEHQKAIALFKSNLHYNDSVQRPRKKALMLVNLSSVYNRLEKYDSAIYYARQGIEDASEFYPSKEIAMLYLNRSLAQVGLKKYKKALEDAKKYDELTINYGFMDRYRAFDLYEQVYAKTGNDKEVVKALRSKLAYKDSLFEESKTREFKKQKVIQEVREKQAALERKEADIDILTDLMTRQKWWRWYLAALSFVLLIVALFFYQRYRYRQRTSKALEMKNELITAQNKKIERINEELESRMLRAQINPHFIFNALNAIQHFIIENDQDSSLRYLTKLSGLLRQVLENSFHVKVSVADELKFLSIYLELESLRFHNDFTYEIIVSEEIDTNLYDVPILILQPFVENAIIHGLLPKNGDKSLCINVTLEGHYLVFIIKDNGVGRNISKGMKPANDNHHKARGLTIAAQRIRIQEVNEYKGLLNIVDLFDEKDQAAGTSVTIRIPIDNPYE